MNKIEDQAVQNYILASRRLEELRHHAMIEILVV